MPGFSRVPAGADMPLILTASKNGVTLERVCTQVVDAALQLYGDARRFDLLEVVH